MRKKIAAVVLFLTMTAFLAGCGPSRPDFLPKTFPTTVTVVDGGSPIEGATVTLLPATPMAGVTVYGTTDATGLAKIGSSAASSIFDGAPAGEYTVIIAKTSGFAVPSELLPVTGESPESAARKEAELAKLVDENRVVPAVLEQQGTSPLKITVDTKGELSVDVAEYKK